MIQPLTPMTIKRFENQLRHLVERGGPTPDEYAAVTTLFREIADLRRAGLLSDPDVARLWDAMGDAMSPETMQGFVTRTPHGYHGDFEIIDRIYQRSRSARSDLRNWDAYFHSCSAVQAVRDRKTYFHQQVDAKARAQSQTSVLNIGSGPARDVAEYCRLASHTDVGFVCVDHDPKAVDYGRRICSDFADRVAFVTVNAFRFRPQSKHDIVWCAGLCDYLSDRAFVRLAQRLHRCLKDRGVLLLANFSNDNPTRDYMEFGNWRLQHRTLEQLEGLCTKAGLSANLESIDAISGGVVFVCRLTA